MQNIEIKAVYPNPEKARTIAVELKSEHVGIERQKDTYFKTAKGRFKLRESTRGGAMLVPYMRPDQSDAKASLYAVIPVPEPEVARRLFSELLGIECVVEKERDLFLYQGVRIHIDRVKGLGSFFELEAVCPKGTPDELETAHRLVEFLIEKFEIGKGNLIQGSYREMLLNRPAE